MKFLIITLLSLSSLAAVVKSESSECTNYQVIDKSQIVKSSQVVSSKNSYGFSIKNIGIDFDNRAATFDLYEAIVMGFDRKVINKRIFINESTDGFIEFIDLHRKDLFFMNSICLKDSGEVVSFTIEE